MLKRTSWRRHMASAAGSTKSVRNMQGDVTPAMLKRLERRAADADLSVTTRHGCQTA
jgi:hypothetical protein